MYDEHHHNESGLTYGLVRSGPKTYERCSRVPCCRTGRRRERQASEACRQSRITDLFKELWEAMPWSWREEERCSACGKPRWLCLKLAEERNEHGNQQAS